MTQHMGLLLELNGEWSDINLAFPPVNIQADTMIYLDVSLTAEQPIALRLCFLSDEPFVTQAEFWREYKPGRSTIIIRGSKFRPMTEVFTGEGITQLMFGGTGVGRLALAIAVSDGSQLLVGGA